MRSLLIGIGGLLFLACAGVAGDPAKEKKQLEGTWEGRAKDKDLKMTVKGDTWIVTIKEGEVFAKGTFTIDVTAKPKRIDLKVEEAKGEDLGNFVGKTSLGIYDLSADTFRWCAAEPGKEARPTEFTDLDHLLVEMKRVK